MTRQHPQAELAQRIQSAAGQKATVTVIHRHRRYNSAPQVYTGTVVTVGQKIGLYSHVSPFCLVIDCRATKQGIAIIALRSITDFTTQEPHE